MGTKEYGRKELERIGYFKEGDDPYNNMVANAILELLEVFDNQGHSGFTAPYVAQMFHRLAMFKPVSPLTGEDDEWDDIGDGLLQNKRYSAVFKDKDGTAYNIEGKVFSDDGEGWYTCKDSRVDVTFPYVVPDKPEYVYRNKQKLYARQKARKQNEQKAEKEMEKESHHYDQQIHRTQKDYQNEGFC